MRQLPAHFSQIGVESRDEREFVDLQSAGGRCNRLQEADVAGRSGGADLSRVAFSGNVAPRRGKARFTRVAIHLHEQSFEAAELFHVNDPHT